ncbi:caspase-6-like [Antedon mediterranea]|uniref:caspase-6-like n=1 Tax=Antedon mediterranea TaxID=105859 RepID=UPI003AF469B5
MASKATSGDNKKYKHLKKEFGKLFTGRFMKELIFLVSGAVEEIDVLSKENVKPLDIFNEMERQDSVSSTKLKIFMDIAELTKSKKAKQLLTDYAAEAENKTQCLKDGASVLPYRHAFYKGLKNTTDDDYREARAYHDLSKYEETIKDIWDVVLYLEKEEFLQTRGQLVEFANLLCGKADKKITDGLKTLATKLPDGKPFIGDEDKLEELVPLQQGISFQQEKKMEETQLPVADIAMTGEDLEIYAMTHTPRGICLIINNVDFKGLTTRDGSDKDEENLKRVFKEFGFKIVSKRNQTAQEMKDVMDEMRRKDHKDYDCFVCCILSHGGYDMVYGSDGEACMIFDLTASVGANSCKSLNLKPKVFFIQACRNTNDPKDDGGGATPKELNETDFLIGYSTAPLAYSYRYHDPNCGSYYIKSLTEALATLHDKHHVNDILIHVNKKVSENKLQVPFPAFSLRKRLYF